MTKGELLKKTIKDLEKIYPEGLYEFVFNNEELDSEFWELDKMINSAVKNGTTEELKSVLREYWQFHVDAIRMLNGKSTYSPTPSHPSL